MDMATWPSLHQPQVSSRPRIRSLVSNQKRHVMTLSNGSTRGHWGVGYNTEGVVLAVEEHHWTSSTLWWSWLQITQIFDQPPSFCNTPVWPLVSFIPTLSRWLKKRSPTLNVKTSVIFFLRERKEEKTLMRSDLKSPDLSERRGIGFFLLFTIFVTLMFKL